MDFTKHFLKFLQCSKNKTMPVSFIVVFLGAGTQKVFKKYLLPEWIHMKKKQSNIWKISYYLMLIENKGNDIENKYPAVQLANTF